MAFEGRVEAVHVQPPGGERRSVQSVQAVADKGLEGDRYFGCVREGVPRPDKAVTLIEAEAIEALARDLGIELEPGETGRNVTTRGVPLNHLVARRFRVGEVVLEGVELCEPCGHLQKQTGKPLLKALLHRGGLRARIVEGGEIRVGDLVSPLP